MEKPGQGKNGKITINENRTISATPGVSLLQALKENGVFLPSACGGHGVCGLCRVQVLEGAAIPLTPAETAHLNPTEQQNNIRLACQVKLEQTGGMAARDLRISIPEQSLHVREYRATVANIRDLTRNIKEISLDLVKPQAITFKSGQYIQLRIPPYPGNKKMTYRAYSIASAPAEQKNIELEVAYTPNGIATTYLFEHLKKGDSVVFNGPHGDFFLRDSEKSIVMVAGGSGMAPIKSMLTDLRDRNIKRKIRFFFGGRAPADIFYADLMSSFERAFPDFRFIPTVDSKRPEEKWDGNTGLVTDIIDRQVEEGFGGEAYLCGSPAMIEACLKILRRKKIPEERIFYDKFA